jgi:hypothetical protein
MTFEARPALKPLKVENTVMEITARALWNLIHCLGFGVLYLLACSGAHVELYRLTIASLRPNLLPLSMNPDVPRRSDSRGSWLAPPNGPAICPRSGH